MYEPRQINELVINWHVTEACNYSCRYCYAHWNKSDIRSEIIHDETRSQKLIEMLYGFFCAKNKGNSLQNRLQWASVRLNVAGGEPLLYEQKVLRVIRVARDIGMNVSIITNGSRLTKPLIEAMAPDISLLGISLDSSNNQTNRGIGRIDKNGLLLRAQSVEEILVKGRQINPQIRLKVNTVVNSLNASEDMSCLIQTLQPERWKVLRMLPVLNNDLAVSDDEFNSFVDRHLALKNVMCIEDNSDMTESYIMVDPYGRFFQNKQRRNGSGYFYSEPILSKGIEAAFSQLTFSTEKFIGRYERISEEVLA
ncbi:radical SAM protein [Undibacterium amnicola]|uniref:S-adenosylmethionine-dependent nucleotide dehydratase n=1 Tax=Undibacterium amnicola TaxID=1834038 RepID=A0ABR6XRC8_9BURK|nr:viperin family antiviral radical SAM protein [Undibacterium amnicola]MBC3831579.1 radical SAM protein [Undibacterium amnicola]